MNKFKGIISYSTMIRLLARETKKSKNDIKQILERDGLNSLIKQKYEYCFGNYYFEN